MNRIFRNLQVLVLFVAASVAADPVHVEHVTRSDPPLRLHIATIDLGDPTVSVHVVRTAPASQPANWECGLQLPSDVADRESLRVAVNGDLFWTKQSIDLFGRKTPYFIGNLANVCGWAMSEHQVWAHAIGTAALLVRRDGTVSIGKFDRLPEDAVEAVGGSQLLLWHKQNIATEGGKDGQPLPRTAAGIDVTGRRLVLLVVDGHRPEYSAGLTTRQLADEMLRLGCSEAMSLDGGGSSVMVEKIGDQPARVVSLPSDGYDLPFAPSLERPVASVLGIRCTTQKSDR